MNMANQPDPDQIRNDVLTENTAQSVLKYLRALEANRASISTRWIWELLQNARDTSLNSDERIRVSIDHNDGELVFEHNGANFNEKQIAHLIYHGSTKVEDEGTIGQYGSGFLTTHLLSSKINVSGKLDGKKTFAFRLNRKAGSVEELMHSMNKAWDDFLGSLSEISTSTHTDTQFRYPINSFDVVKDGLRALKQFAPFVIVFNPEFSTISIKSEATDYEVCKESEERQQDDVLRITIAEHENGNCTKRVYLLAKSEKTSVTIPIQPMGSSQRCLSADNSPRLFLGFPLIGTEKFSFPAVINSFAFTPTEDRDGVYLAQSGDEANQKNQQIMEEACELLLHLLRFTASSDWRHTYLLADIPPIPEPTWLNVDWLRKTIQKQLVEKICRTPAVLNEAGNPIVPEEATLLLPNVESNVEVLWDLLNQWEEFRKTLGRRNEAVGWWRVVNNWAAIFECGPISLFETAIDGERLASTIEKVTCKGSDYGQIDGLQNLLLEGTSAIEWLDQAHIFFRKDELHEAVRKYHIVPAQNGFLNKLSELHRDHGIPKKLKDIAELLDWPIRSELRDTRLTSLADEVGAGEWDGEYVLKELIDRLKKCGEEDNLDNKFKETSVSLFSWIVEQKDWDRLSGFPVFSLEEENDPTKRRGIKLEKVEMDAEGLLAPVKSWSEALQPYSDLFPRRYILADAYFETTSTSDTWEALKERGFVKKDVIISKIKNIDFKKFHPDESLSRDENEEHKTLDDVTATNIAFLTKDEIGIMARVRQNQKLARLFWRFLTDWLVKHDAEGLVNSKAPCCCEGEHGYFPGEWLAPVKSNKWIPLGDRKSSLANAKSLASLLRDSELNISTLHYRHSLVIKL